MRKARFTEHRVITVLKSVAAGCTVKDVCREAAISAANLTKYKIISAGGDEKEDLDMLHLPQKIYRWKGII